MTGSGFLLFILLVAFPPPCAAISTGAIIGVAVAVPVLLAISIVAAWMLWKKKKTGKAAPSTMDDHSPQSATYSPTSNTELMNKQGEAANGTDANPLMNLASVEHDETLSDGSCTSHQRAMSIPYDNQSFARTLISSGEDMIVVGDAVTLSCRPHNTGPLSEGEVGVVVEDGATGSEVRFCVRGPRGGTGWFTAAQLKKASQDYSPLTSIPEPTASPRRKSVRLHLQDGIAEPRGFHRAPIGASILVRDRMGDWKHGTVIALNANGTHEVELDEGGYMSSVTHDAIQQTAPHLALASVQGRWYDGRGCRWNVAGNMARCSRPTGTTTIRFLVETASGMVQLEGVRLQRVSPAFIAWDNGEIWRRVNGVECRVTDPDLDIMWSQGMNGLVVESVMSPETEEAGVKRGMVLHSVNGICVYSRAELRCLMEEVLEGSAITLRFAYSSQEEAPETPPDSPVITSDFPVGTLALSLWGGTWRKCIVSARTADGNYEIEWVDGGSWISAPMGMRRMREQKEEDKEAEGEACALWNRAIRLFYKLQRASDTTSSPPDLSLSRSVLSASHLATTLSSIDVTVSQDVTIPRSSMLRALRLTRPAAKTVLRQLEAPHDTLTLRNWLGWVGLLAERGEAVARLDWIEDRLLSSTFSVQPERIDSNSSDHFFPPIPTPRARAAPPREPPVVDCVLLEPGRGKVVGEAGSVVRKGERLDTPEVAVLTQGTLIDVDEIRGRRARVVAPCIGWVSVTTADGDTLIAEGPRPKLNEATVVKLKEEPSGATFEKGVLVSVGQGSPADRARMRGLVGRKLLAIGDSPCLAGTEISEIEAGETTLTYYFEEVGSEEIEVRKLPDESLGLELRDGVLADVVPKSPADQFGTRQFVGRRLTHVNNLPLSSASALDVAGSGATTVLLRFQHNTLTMSRNGESKKKDLETAPF